MKKIKLIGLLILLTALVSCSQIKDSGVKTAPANEGKTGAVEAKKEASVPVNLKNAVEDARIFKETSIVLTLPGDNEILLGKDAQPLKKEDLTAKMTQLSRDFPPDERIVYIKAVPTLGYKRLAEILDAIRRADLEKIGFVVGKTGNPTGKDIFEIKIPAVADDKIPLKPNPLFLLVSISKDSKLRLNMDDQTPDDMKEKLREIFRYREQNGNFREGTNEVEKTIFVKPSPSVSYGEIAKLIDALRETGAEPIGLQIDDLSDQ